MTPVAGIVEHPRSIVVADTGRHGALLCGRVGLSRHLGVAADPLALVPDSTRASACSLVILTCLALTGLELAFILASNHSRAHGSMLRCPGMPSEGRSRSEGSCDREYGRIHGGIPLSP